MALHWAIVGVFIGIGLLLPIRVLGFLLDQKLNVIISVVVVSIFMKSVRESDPYMVDPEGVQAVACFMVFVTLFGLQQVFILKRRTIVQEFLDRLGMMNRAQGSFIDA